MKSLPLRTVVEKIVAEVQGSDWDDLVDVYNELFPIEPISIDDRSRDSDILKLTIVDRIRKDFAPEEVVDVWNVVFPNCRDVWYDEDDSVLHFEDESEAIEI